MVAVAALLSAEGRMSIIRYFTVTSSRLVCQALTVNPVFTGMNARSFTSGVIKDKEPLRKPKTPLGRFDSSEKEDAENKDVLERFPDDINPTTKEKGGPRGPEPTRYGDWERKGRCIDF